LAALAHLKPNRFEYTLQAPEENVMAAQPESIPQDELALGIQRHQNGELREAEIIYRRIIKANPNNAEALYWLGTLGHQTGKNNHALPLLQRAIELKADDWRFHNNISVIYRNLGDYSRAIAHSARATQLAPAEYEPLINLGQLYGILDQVDNSIINLSRALNIVPMHEEARLNLWGSYRRLLPDWYFSMLNDERRNKAYGEAIRSAVNKNSRVLEVGLGGALFSMMASLAGAKDVRTCISSRCLAQRTGDVLSVNGFKEKVTLIERPLLSIREGSAELPERANVFIIDVLDPALLGQGVLPIVTFARQYLLTEDAKFIPEAAVVQAVLIESAEINALAQADEVSGFDMSALSIFKQRPMLNLDLSDHEYTALSQEKKIFRLDFKKDTFINNTQEIDFEITKSGQCHAIAYWFKLDLDKDIRYDNAPNSMRDSNQTHWMQCVQVLDKPLSVNKKQTLRFRASQRNKYIWFDKLK
jgi:type II protein arginine methyltransferase